MKPSELVFTVFEKELYSESQTLVDRKGVLYEVTRWGQTATSNKPDSYSLIRVIIKTHPNRPDKRVDLKDVGIANNMLELACLISGLEPHNPGR